MGGYYFVCNVSPAKGELCGAVILFSTNILSPFLLAKTLGFCFRAIIPLTLLLEQLQRHRPGLSETHPWPQGFVQGWTRDIRTNKVKYWNTCWEYWERDTLFFFFPAGSEPGRYLHSSLPTTQSLRMKPKWKPGDSRDGQTGLKDRILTFEKSHSWNSHTFGFLVTWVSTF